MLCLTLSHRTLVTRHPLHVDSGSDIHFDDSASAVGGDVPAMSTLSTFGPTPKLMPIKQIFVVEQAFFLEMNKNLMK